MDFLFRVWRGSLDARYFRVVRRLYRAIGYSDYPEARGRRLLRRWLSKEQREQFDALDCFEVIGCHTAKRYRINYGTAANVDEPNEAGRPQMRLCFVPLGQLVPGDVMLAQKIALETDELAAIAVANRFAPREHTAP